MATPFSKPIDAFLMKVKDLDLLTFHDDDKNEIVKQLLRAASTRIRRTVYKTTEIDLYSIDETAETFTDDLDEDIIDILSEFMIVEWLKPSMYYTENLQNFLNTASFNAYSPANLLKEIRSTYKECKKEAYRLLRDYTFSNGKVDELSSD